MIRSRNMTCGWGTSRFLLAALVGMVVVGAAVGVWHENDLGLDDNSGEDVKLVHRSLLSDGPAKLSFVSFGDWGCGPHNCMMSQQDTNPVAAKTADFVMAEMAASAKAADSRFVLALGDNFYWRGVQSENDPLWQSVFEERSTLPGLQTPWFVILGNHDHYGNADAQIIYSQKQKDPR